VLERPNERFGYLARFILVPAVKCHLPAACLPFWEIHLAAVIMQYPHNTLPDLREHLIR